MLPKHPPQRGLHRKDLFEQRSTIYIAFDLGIALKSATAADSDQAVQINTQGVSFIFGTFLGSESPQDIFVDSGLALGETKKTVNEPWYYDLLSVVSKVLPGGQFEWGQAGAEQIGPNGRALHNNQFSVNANFGGASVVTYTYSRGAVRTATSGAQLRLLISAAKVTVPFIPAN